MKKVGIITFHRAINYGAKLQAYALQEVLKEKCDISIIDYRCPFIENSYYGKKNKVSLKTIIKYLFFYGKIRRIKKEKDKLYLKFNNFDQKFLILSEKEYFQNNISEANNVYDIFISGSDQVWNLRMTGHDWNYYLDFAEERKKYSYAASFGGDILNEDANNIGLKLKHFQSILVREDRGAKIVYDTTNRKVLTVCDPVFLIRKEEWISGLNLNKEKLNEKYVLLAEVAPMTYSFEFAKKLAKKENLKIYYINIKGRIKLPYGFKCLNSIGPCEFLDLILNASYVVTTSFHALAYSLIFNVPFFYELDKSIVNNNDRIINLVDELKIEKREITSKVLSGDYNNRLDWNKINSIIEDYSCRSKEILFKSLNIMQ